MVQSGSGELPVVEGINKDFWSLFGGPEDEQSYVHGSQILVVRHAQSQENLHWMNNEQGDLAQLTDDIIYGKLQDCHISEHGV